MGMTSAAPATETAPRTFRSVRPIRPTRGQLLDLLTEALAAPAAGGGEAAWQGPVGAPRNWRYSTGAADLDIWCDPVAYHRLNDLLRGLQGARVQHADDARRLRHTSYAVETNDGIAVVDLTRGDLSVGPVLMVPASDVRVGVREDGQRLSGIAAAADLFVRPLLRGRIVDDARLSEARTAWAQAREMEQSAFIHRLNDQLGRTVADGVAHTLSGATPDASLVSAARKALMRASVRPSALASTWKQRHTIRPAGRRGGMLGLSTTGCLVVLVGTDGSGKSTVAGEIAERLERLEVKTTPAYMGMARGNLPGVGLARKVLGVAPAGDAAPVSITTAKSTSTDPKKDHAMVRRAAAWYYAAEYVYRYWRDIRPGMRNGGVVIADRYVYDLRESPWPGSRASRVAEALMPKPDVLVLPDAPDRLIHARKPERPAHEQAEQQARFRTLVASKVATTASITVDTSGLGGADLDPVAPVVSAVMTAVHRRHA
jgi:thymidylate kinase